MSEWKQKSVSREWIGYAYISTTDIRVHNGRTVV